jgi:hypothetical protein
MITKSPYWLNRGKTGLNWILISNACDMSFFENISSYNTKMTDSSITFHLTKQLRKMMNRIEKILAPSNAISNQLIEIGPRLELIMKKIQNNEYYREPEIKNKSSPRNKQETLAEPTMECMFACRIVDWESLEPDIIQAITNGDANMNIPDKILQEIHTERKIQHDALVKLRAKEKLRMLEVCDLASTYI